MPVSQLSGLVISLGMEVPLAMAMGLGLSWVEKTEWKRLLVVAVTTTLLTHPFAWWGYRGLRWELGWSYGLALSVVEVLVTLAEAAVYWRAARIPPGKALILAAVVNACSALWGGELRGILGLS